MHHHHHHPQSTQNNHTGSIVDTESIADDVKSVVGQQEERKKDNHFEVPYDIETETKSISSIKSAGSNQELRYFPITNYCFALKFVLNVVQCIFFFLNCFL